MNYITVEPRNLATSVIEHFTFEHQKVVGFQLIMLHN